MKASTFPSSEIDASRLSSAKNGKTEVEPARGRRLAGVFVICWKVPADRSCNGKSVPRVKSTSATAGSLKIQISELPSLARLPSVPSKLAGFGAFELKTIV